MNIQFKKGILELLVLSLLLEKDRYGYELVNEISKNISISEGTIYPLLRRLNKDGYFESYLKESTEGPPRKYYKITKSGKEAYENLYSQWQKFIYGVSCVLKENEDD